MTKSSISAERLREAAQRASSQALSLMAERMNVELDDSLLTCTYQGTNEDDAPLRSETSIVFEWRLLDGQSVKTYTVPQQVLYTYRYKKGMSLPTSFKKAFFFACLPIYFQRCYERWANRLPFLRKLPAVSKGGIRCHRVVHPKPALQYKSASFVVKGSVMEFALIHTGVADVYLCASVNPSAKKCLFLEKPVADGGYKEHTLKGNLAIIDEAVALGILEKENRLAQRQRRPIDMVAATSGFSSDFDDHVRGRDKIKQKTFLLWFWETIKGGWALRADAFDPRKFRKL